VKIFQILKKLMSVDLEAGKEGIGKKMKLCKAHEKHQSEEEDELQFPEGAVISVIDQGNDSTWWFGEYGRKPFLIFVH
jgi:hypothetical protein